MVLAQVISVQTYRPGHLKQDEFSPVIGGKCRVIETIAGAPIHGELTIVNPSEEEQQPKPYA